MTKLVVAIIFCGMCISVFSKDDAKNCIFNWEYFTFEGSTDVIDASEQKLSILEEGDKTYHYITGPYKVKTVVDSSYDAYYDIKMMTDDGSKTIAKGFRDICYYLENIRPTYLLPIIGSHSNFPSQETFCPLNPGTFNVQPIENSAELMAPSELDEGKYQWSVTYFKNKAAICGFRGIFTVLRS